MWHYSPPNVSDHSKIGMGAVWVDWKQSQTSPKEYFWVMKDGIALTYPPEKLIVNDEKYDPSFK